MACGGNLRGSSRFDLFASSYDSGRRTDGQHGDAADSFTDPWGREGLCGMASDSCLSDDGSFLQAAN